MTGKQDIFKVVHAVGLDWKTAVDSCVEEVGPLTRADRVGFIYATDAFAGALPDIVAELRKRMDVTLWVGTAANGIISGANEYALEPALTIMVGTFPWHSFCYLPRLVDNMAPLRASAGNWLLKNDPAIAFIHADPRNHRLSRLLKTLASRVGFLLGGLTSSRGDHQPQVAGTITEGGVSGVLFGPEVTILTALAQGCTPAGPLRTVTGADGYVAVSIDNKPSLSVLCEDTGLDPKTDLDRVRNDIFLAFPVEGSDTGDYTPRDITSVDQRRMWFAASRSVDVGDTVFFCRRDPAAAEVELREMLRKLKTRLEGRIIKGGVYVSHVARRETLFGESGSEVAILREELGEFPLVGFMAKGEICNNRFYSYTGVLTLFV